MLSHDIEYELQQSIQKTFHEHLLCVKHFLEVAQTAITKHHKSLPFPNELAF